jgi:hypothetical protein
MADQQDRPEPDHTEDPRGKGVGEGGYAEENPAATVPPGEPGEQREPDADTSAGEAAGEAPSTSSPSEGSPGQATGNPDAAGG